MKKLSDIIDGVMAIEGGYVNNPNDKGGATNFGITEETARLNGYYGPIKELPRHVAFDILMNVYIKKPGFDLIFNINEKIGIELIDTGVNCGPSVPSKWLQTCLNAFNKQGKLYGELEVDGKAGKDTRAALVAYLNKRGSRAESVMLKALNCLQGQFYIQITEKRKENEDFIFGWFDNRVTLP